MKQYLDLMRYVHDYGSVKTDRTGTGTVSKFAQQMRFDLNKGFPLLTTKKLHLKAIIHELLWFLAGDTNVKYLQDNGVTIWDEWADENGELGPVYGAQWRAWKDTQQLSSIWDAKKITKLLADGYEQIGEFEIQIQRNGCTAREKRVLLEKTFDQISDVMAQLKNNPHSRRMIVSAWNVPEISNMKLPPCHSLFQFYVEDLTLLQRERLFPGAEVSTTTRSHAFYDKEGVPRQRLSCSLYQRSADIFLGVPFNIASYAMLTHMFADQLKMAVGEFVWTGGDCHLYANHAQQAELQLTRTPRKLPSLVITNARDSIFDYKYEDFMIIDYSSESGISAPVAV